MSGTPRRNDDTLLPWEKRWDEPRSGTPKDVPDNVAERKTLLYGPNGHPLIVQEPRPLGFRRKP